MFNLFMPIMAKVTAYFVAIFPKSTFEKYTKQKWLSETNQQLSFKFAGLINLYSQVLLNSTIVPR